MFEWTPLLISTVVQHFVRGRRFNRSSERGCRLIVPHFHSAYGTGPYICISNARTSFLKIHRSIEIGFVILIQMKSCFEVRMKYQFCDFQSKNHSRFRIVVILLKFLELSMSSNMGKHFCEFDNPSFELFTNISTRSRMMPLRNEGATHSESNRE